LLNFRTVAGSGCSGGWVQWGWCWLLRGQHPSYLLVCRRSFFCPYKQLFITFVGASLSHGHLRQRTTSRKSTKCRALSGTYLQILWEKAWSEVIYMPLSHYLLYLKYLKFSPTFKFHKNWIQKVTIGVSNWAMYLYIEKHCVCMFVRTSYLPTNVRTSSQTYLHAKNEWPTTINAGNIHP
jgi:hypothetical protein